MAGARTETNEIVFIKEKKKDTEVRIALRSVKPFRGPTVRYLDMREMWYRDGPESEPLFTKKGTMIPRHDVAPMLVSLLELMNIEDFTDGDITALHTRVTELKAQNDALIAEGNRDKTFVLDDEDSEDSEIVFDDLEDDEDGA